MCITVEEMNELLAQYDKAIVEYEMKKAVVKDFIAIAEAKEPCKCEAVETIDTVQYEMPVVETATDESY
jgi:hypothetical protein